MSRGASRRSRQGKRDKSERLRWTFSGRPGDSEAWRKSMLHSLWSGLRPSLIKLVATQEHRVNQSVTATTEKKEFRVSVSLLDAWLLSASVVLGLVHA